MQNFSIIKKATTHEEQMEILKTRGIIVNDGKKCINILKLVNYYRLTAYMQPFKDGENHFMPVTIERIYCIYEFDRRMRSLVLEVLEEIELEFRTNIAYFHAHKYGPLGYEKAENFNKNHNHASFLARIKNAIEKNEDNAFVRHHNKKYGSKFPIWAVIELFPFGLLSLFYADMLSNDKKALIRGLYPLHIDHVESWLHCATILRNRCAHFMRLYYFDFTKTPKPYPGNYSYESGKVFDYIYILRFLYTDPSKWNTGFLNQLCALISHYSDEIELSHIGFPDNWEKLLTCKC